MKTITGQELRAFITGRTMCTTDLAENWEHTAANINEFFNPDVPPEEFYKYKVDWEVRYKD